MSRERHISLTGTGRTVPFTSPRTGRGKFSHPPRDRAPHADKLTREANAVDAAAKQHLNSAGPGITVRGLAIECISSIDHELKTDSLSDRTLGLEVLSTRTVNNRELATVFVPEGKLPKFLEKVESYKNDDTDSGKPRNQPLIESIDSIQIPILKSFWTDADALFPAEENKPAWLEVWLRVEEAGEEPSLDRFRQEASRVGLQTQDSAIRFPSRIVVIAYGSLQMWSRSILLLGDVAELRLAKHAPTDFIELTPRDIAPLVEDGANRVSAAPASAPAVCILDTGIQSGHPLLTPATTASDVHTIEDDWGAADNHGHGTQMAGLAVYGERLEDHLLGDSPLALEHRIESVKLFDKSQEHDPPSYGAKTTESVAIAEAKAPDRNRTICLAITADDRDRGYPSSWSAAIDQHAAGALDDSERRRLYLVSAGNIQDLPHLASSYPELNRNQRGIEDPGQSWNALTVGAFTDQCLIRDPDLHNHSPVAPLGGLSPKSRTSMMWEAKDWPIKPDLVMEGGNYAEENGNIDQCDDLQLLTTTWSRTGKQLETMADTSAATALAARLATRLSAAYPSYWPETIRALLVHSAQWTKQMLEEFPGNTKDQLHSRLRCYGYGVPDEQKAFWTAANIVTLVAQDELTPFKKDNAPATNECRFHDLPWPKDVLEALPADQEVTVRVTLSYFIEPSPGKVRYSNGYRYASHGLRFAMRGKEESDSAFEKRISKASWTDEEKTKREERPTTSEQQDWTVGPTLRTRGSVHSDWFTAPAADVGRAGRIAVYPVTGWWRERHHLGQITSKARYALIVTISTPEASTDLLTPIRTAAGTPVRIST